MKILTKNEAQNWCEGLIEYLKQQSELDPKGTMEKAPVFRGPYFGVLMRQLQVVKKAIEDNAA